MKGLFFAFLTLIFCSGYFPCAATELPKVSDVSGIIHKVNRYWQTTHPKHSWSFWDHAAYHTGNMEAYFLTGDTAYYLYTVEPDERKIARAREVMEYEMSTDRSDYWWWADGLYMVMPVMTKLYKVTGNPLYLEKLHEYWEYANSIMYDA